MSKVQFKRGLKAQIPMNSSLDTLLFSLDTNELFMGRGVGNPLALIGSVYYGYDNLVDLQLKSPIGIVGKLYLTEDAKLYTYIDGMYQLVAGSSGDISSFEADKVTYDNTASTLISTNAQTAINELDSKVEINKNNITDIQGQLSTIDNDTVQLKSDVEDLLLSEGQVKSSANDALGYLSDKVDGITIEVVNDELVVKSIDGVTVSVTEINQLTGITGNVESQLVDLRNAITSVASGLNFGGVYPTYQDLDDITTKVNGGLYVVSVDETKDDGRTLYVYSEDMVALLYLGKFEFAESFTELLDTPNTHEANKYLMSNGSALVFADIDYANLLNKPTSSVVDIDDAVAKKHEHNNLSILDKFTEDVDGKLQFDNQPLGGEITWEEFNI